MKRILSGVQPTGNLHLGNYLGAIRQWVALQDEYESLFMLADLHAITVPQEPARLKAHVRETAAAYIACGIDPKKSAIFPQSSVAAHSELAWVLNCNTPLGWLNRMTQFKEKSKQTLESRDLLTDLNNHFNSLLKKLEDGADTKEEINHITEGFKILKGGQKLQRKLFDEAPLGILSYPVLMAADILIYKASHVPVGADQKQHVELCRDIAGAFNRQYKADYFTLPEPVIMGEATRVMSLGDGSKKMSKSDPSENSRINLTDDADTIAKKFKKATSDSFPTLGEDTENRPEALNLLSIYAAFKGITRKQAIEEFSDKNFSALKQQLADVAVAHMAPITQKMRELLEAPDYLDDVLRAGVEKAGGIAGKTMNEVKELVGFLAL